MLNNLPEVPNLQGDLLLMEDLLCDKHLALSWHLHLLDHSPLDLKDPRGHKHLLLLDLKQQNLKNLKEDFPSDKNQVILTVDRSKLEPQEDHLKLEDPQKDPLKLDYLLDLKFQQPKDLNKHLTKHQMHLITHLLAKNCLDLQEQKP